MESGENARPAQRPAALITGGSRGIGAATALALARHGYDVALTYRNKAARAQEVATEIERLGGRALPVACDITQDDQLDALMAQLATWTSNLRILSLNASGGMERDLVAADPNYPMRINRDAQTHLLARALPHLAPGSTIIFVTSHWAHLYGRVPQIPAYEPVAASKYAGEQELRAALPDLTRRGIRLLIVTGDLIEGTITPKLLERAAPGLGKERRTTTGPLPTATEMGQAIADAALDPTLPTGHVVVIGGALDSI